MLSQACEQLNSWLSGFQPMLNRMTVTNLIWYTHVLLFMHAARVHLRTEQKAAAAARRAAAPDEMDVDIVGSAGDGDENAPSDEEDVEEDFLDM